MAAMIWNQVNDKVCAIALHLVPDARESLLQDIKHVRYFDRYRRDVGIWRLAMRTVAFDRRYAVSVDDDHLAAGRATQVLSYADFALPQLARAGGGANCR
ncbi:hypothetical protein [Sphingobium tyrosinilyticum]|uniref:hypothetical protein n=1 Tax=Sphingobium tyrosinilyticum TaxID=2715436 RepID=UPI0036D39E74